MTAPLVLVTGASGGIGTRMLEALGETGWRRRALVHRNPVDDCDETVTGELSDPASLRRAVADVEAVVHAAALTHSRSASRYDAVNVVGTQNLAQAASKAGVRRFLFISTRAISEDGGAYSRSKRRAEEIVRSADVPWTIVRLPEVYGAGGAEGIDRMIALARRGRRVPVVGRGDDIICPAHIDDVVGACVRALGAPAAVGRTYTLAGPCMSVREFVGLACDAFGSGTKTLPVPTSLVAVLGHAARIVPLGLYPDQLERLRAAKPAPSPEALTDLMFRARAVRDGLVTNT